LQSSLEHSSRPTDPLARDGSATSEALPAEPFPLVYEELRRVAHRHLEREAEGHTLSTTALVHEAYLRLRDHGGEAFNDRAHFFAMAARAMRRILVDHARRHHAAKRGDGARRVPLESVERLAADGLAVEERAELLVALDEALERLAALDARQADHPKKACELMASRRFGRYLRMDARGRLSIDTTKVAAEAKYDGKFVVTTNDDTLDAEDVALGYTSMTLIEGCFRRMKTTGLQTRPIYHWRSHRIIAHVKLCVLALLLERAAELRCQQTWRTIRHTLDQLKVVRYRMHGKTILQSTQVTSPLAKILRSLHIPLPKKILEVSD